MMPRRAAFLQWLAIMIGLSIAAFYAGYCGLIDRIWKNDLSHMSVVIAAVAVGSALYIGMLCWKVPDNFQHADGRLSYLEDGSEWGGFAANVCPMLGLFGTVYGISLQTAALKEGGDVLSLLSTALFTTMCGVLACAAIGLLNFVLQAALRRGRRGA